MRLPALVPGHATGPGTPPTEDGGPPTHPDGQTTVTTPRYANQIESAGLLADQPIAAYPGKTPCLLGQAYDLAEQKRTNNAQLARDLAWSTPRVRDYSAASRNDQPFVLR